MSRLRAVTASVAAVLAAGLVLVPAAGASAHDYLVGSDPAADATVTAPLDEVTLTFNDRVLDLSGDGSSSLVTVTGPAAGTRHFETGCATTADTTVSAPVALGAAGSYTIKYQIVSADGHTVSNSYSFTYQPPAGTVEAPGSDTATCGKAAFETPTTPGGDATTQASEPAGGSRPTESAGSPLPTATADDPGDLGLVIGIAVGIVVLALVGVLVVVLTSRRKPGAGRPASDPGSDDTSRGEDEPTP
jgi:methionine-rich copper-binding protein CopC